MCYRETYSVSRRVALGLGRRPSFLELVHLGVAKVGGGEMWGCLHKVTEGSSVLDEVGGYRQVQGA